MIKINNKVQIKYKFKSNIGIILRIILIVLLINNYILCFIFKKSFENAINIGSIEKNKMEEIAELTNSEICNSKINQFEKYLILPCSIYTQAINNYYYFDNDDDNNNLIKNIKNKEKIINLNDIIYFMSYKSNLIILLALIINEVILKNYYKNKKKKK